MVIFMLSACGRARLAHTVQAGQKTAGDPGKRIGRLFFQFKRSKAPAVGQGTRPGGGGGFTRDAASMHQFFCSRYRSLPRRYF
jgi:hypothetical protein